MGRTLKFDVRKNKTKCPPKVNSVVKFPLSGLETSSPAPLVVTFPLSAVKCPRLMDTTSLCEEDTELCHFQFIHLIGYQMLFPSTPELLLPASCYQQNGFIP